MITPPTKHPGVVDCFPRGFTLVELMVSLVIIALLSSLTLAGLGAVRQRTKIDKTKSTIRKIHELVIPRYESYIRRRVPLSGTATSGSAIASERLSRVRTLSLVELPDHWNDVASSGTSASGSYNSGGGALPSYAWNGIARSYGNYFQGLTGNPADKYPSGECLYMIVAFGLRDSDEMMNFRSDEVGDFDGDGAMEFRDGWGNPIMYVRWPIAYQSVVQSQDASKQPEPLDPFRVSNQIAYPNPAVSQRDYAVIPLIASAGPDGEYGIATGAAAWSSFATFTTIRLMSGTSAPGYKTSDADDNIVNHAMVVQ